MKKIILLVLGLCFVFSLVGQETESLIEIALALESEDYQDALDFMERQVSKYTENVDLLSVYGLILSRSAGKVNFFTAGRYSKQAEQVFAKALQLEPEHKNSILWRGILRVNVPKFLQKLSLGIADLEKILVHPQASQEDILVASYFLGLGYEKEGNTDKALVYWEKIVEYGETAPYYQEAVDKIEMKNGREERRNLATENTEKRRFSPQRHK